MHHTQLDSWIEKTIIVAVTLPRHQHWEVEDNLSELKQLAVTSGAEVVDELLQELQRINPAHFLGKGKVEELKRLVKLHGASTVIFDDDLTPAQIRNLEKTIEAKIIDRSTLILDIFAKHAHTREAKTQVELAQLQHLLPRLTRQWTHLSRQVGGIGTKGPGETQLETDRRLVRTRIGTLQKELQKIDQRRLTRRKGRKNVYKASLVGYTNVGKSTIMNLLTDANVPVEDQLFATLDSTVRRVSLDRDHRLLISDTVGFIRKLPHDLVASFKSTLDEVAEADLLLHVVDISHGAFLKQIHTVNEVVKDIGAIDKPVLMIFNKIDLLKEKALIQSLKHQFPQSVFISATRHIGMEYLRRALSGFVEDHFAETTVKIPLTAAYLVGRIYSLAVVVKEKYSDSHVMLTFKATDMNHARIRRIIANAAAVRRVAPVDGSEEY